MSTLQKTTKIHIAAWGLLLGLCLPAFAETPLPHRERRNVGDLDSDSVIPVAANSPGRFGAHFKTRVVIFNPTSRDYRITASLYDGRGLAGTEEISMDSGHYSVWDNFLEKVFDYRGSGGIWLTATDPDDRFYVTAEVYTDSPNGRFSTTVVNGIYPLASEGYESNYNEGINVSASRRTNIGVLNWELAPSSIEARVYDGDGTLVQTIRFNLAGEAWQQKSISAPVDNGFVVWDVDGDSAAHYFYAVEVDNRSNDGTLSWAVQGSSSGGGGSSAPDLVVEAPSVSHSSPAAGASFTLSATVRNQGNGPSAATTLHYYRSSDAAISTGDSQVGTDPVEILSASGASAESISLTAPSSAGTYYYGACVEPVSGESNAGNNCSNGVRVTVSPGNGSAGFDLDPGGNADPYGTTFANGRLYVVDSADEKVYAYDLSGRRLPAADFDLFLDNADPNGITFANGRFHVVDASDYKVYAYDSSGRRLPAADFDLFLDNADPNGITFANGRFYVVNTSDKEVYAYDPSGRYLPAANFDLEGPESPHGITFANGRFYVVDESNQYAYAYDPSGRRLPAADFDLASDYTDPRGITFANGRLYMVDTSDDKVYAYDPSGRRLPAADFDLASLGSADPRGITFANGRLYMVDSADHKVYAYDLSGRRLPAADFDLASDYTDPRGITFANGRLYVVDNFADADKVYAYDPSGRYLPAADFDLASDYTEPSGITFANGRLYVVNWVDDKVYAYDPSGRRLPAADFDLDPANRSPDGITFANGRLYVVDRFRDKVYAYDPSGRRLPAADFDLASDNTDPRGITFANGRFYVVDTSDDKVYAYDPS